MILKGFIETDLFQFVILSDSLSTIQYHLCSYWQFHAVFWKLHWTMTELIPL